MIGAVVVFGAGGQVGRALSEAKPPPGLRITGYARRQADITEPESVARALAAAAPVAAVVNAAAYTDVDGAESHRDEAFAVNADGAGSVARACAAAAVPLVHLSTDYVFDGSKATAYGEDDPPRPLGVYGRSKLAGEEAVGAWEKAVILRTAWVYAPFGHNFVRTMLRLAGERDSLGVVDDQQGSPTSARDIAAAVLAITAALAAGKGGDLGLFHFCGGGGTTWYGFAEAIFALAEARGLAPRPELRPIATPDYPTPAARPANSRLACSRLAETHGIVAPPWRDSLARCLDEIAANR